MNCKKLLKKLLALFCSPILYVVAAYMLLIIGFIMIIMQSHTASESEWFSENFSMNPEPPPKECKIINGFYSKLLNEQESLGQEFERVVHQNLWDLYES